MLRHGVAVALLVLAGIVGVVGVVDHHHKQARLEEIEADEWWCTHRGTRCGGESSRRIEARWNSRERAYVVAVVLLGASGATVGAASLEKGFRRRRRNR